MSALLRILKYFLTKLGAKLSSKTILRLQATLNYVRIGGWVRNQGFCFPIRYDNRQGVWNEVIRQVRTQKVLYLEFGVAAGESMAYWSRALEHPDAALHGFDSFEGLPQGGGPWIKGQFSTAGRVPSLADPRVKFFKGWFDQVLPSYSPPAHDVLIANFDADLYSSTIYVLQWLRPYIRPGSFLYFDEMNHVEEEPRAFAEFIAETGLRFMPLAADKTLAFAVFQACREQG